ncbi:MAG: DNA gyrase subunit B [Phycisphaerae bacterium]|nr:DNA gyrase subunit B [Phycisphaerae bacterium]
MTYPSEPPSNLQKIGTAASDANAPVNAGNGPVASADYTSNSIQVLEGLEAIRKRPGMYVGGTGLNALHHLVYECVDNSIDEVMAGYATVVTVRIAVDGSCTVIDDGRGMPVDPMRHENPAINGRPAVEVILTEVHAGGKFGDNAYKVSGGLHGVGVKCVNALSEWTEVEVFRDHKTYVIAFARGKVTEPLHVTHVADMDDPAVSGAPPRKGTRISFLPDREIFPDTVFRYEALEHRLRELAYLNSGVTIRFNDERVDASGNRRNVTFHDEHGLAAYVAHLNSAKAVDGPVIAFATEDSQANLRCEIAMQYTDATNENVLAFGNNIFNADGGTHLQGFKSALTRTINGYAKQKGLLKDLTPTGDDLREGLTAIVSLKLPNPQFNNQTKEKLLNDEVEGFVSGVVGDRLAAWLEEHPKEARRICDRAVLAAEAREAARKARELIKRKGSLDSGGMPHKLADCSSDDVEKTELFIVEGDSAGGSAKGGRDHVTQAILPLRGKLLNVEKARLDKVLGFEEIRTLIQALQCGIGDDFDISKLRYGRIVIMTDADVDGSHIRTLLLTFFFRQMTELVKRGKIFIAQPPLFQIAKGKSIKYVLNDRAMSDALVEIALKHAKLAVRDERGVPVHTVEGLPLRRLIQTLHRLDELVNVSQRRGIPFRKLLDSRSRDPSGERRLPIWHLAWQEGDELFWSDTEAHRVLRDRKLVLDEDTAEVLSATPRNRIATLRELHENRELERLFQELSSNQLAIDDWGLVQEELITGERAPTRYAWMVEGGGRAKPKIEAHDDDDGGETSEGAERVDASHVAEEPAPSATTGGAKVEFVEAASIPSILKTLLDVGRRGIELKRFKGLGEMDAIQLWETTMDPKVRTLLRVSWDSVSEADALFATLMGENVEQRRAYIEKYAIEAKNLDV